MSREEKAMLTKSKIIETAFQMFAKKGYEQTTLKEIIDNTELSKGAIYHHFKSKQEILEYMTSFQQSEINNFLRELIKKDELSTKEKVSYIIDYFAQNSQQKQLIQNGWVEKIPFALLEAIRNTNNNIAVLISEILKQGISKNEFSCEYPQEVAEVFIILFDIWLDPVIFKRTFSEVCDRIDFIVNFVNKFDAPILDHKETTKIKNLYRNYCL